VTFHARHSLIRESRALLLDFLNAAYPKWLPEDELVDVMLDLPDPQTADYTLRDLAYLQQRGLVERSVERHPVRPHEREKRWRLAAEGKTFVERDKPWDDLEGKD